MSGQVVDTASAEEFMAQALEKISEDDLRQIALDLERKAARFHDTLHHRAGESLPPDELRVLLRMIFGVRRNVDALFEGVGGEALAGHVADLLWAPEPVTSRLDRFCAALDGVSDAPGLATELLHFSMPDRYWLWTKWMWDPSNETGALRLVTMDEHDLSGATPGETYMKVGEAIAFVHQTGEAVGFTRMGAGLFGIDVFLACVYGIYMYTVLRMRMTQEFNHIVPQLPELARRLLGVWKLEV